MENETERKFLVSDGSFRQMATSSDRIVQAYLSDAPEATVRVRLRGDQAFLTVKGLTEGCTRKEFEYPVPVSDALEMASLVPESCRLAKRRWIVPYKGYIWEVDEFEGRLAPLIVAEVEMPSEDCHPLLPPFAGREVTGIVGYYNSELIKGLPEDFLNHDH